MRDKETVDPDRALKQSVNQERFAAAVDPPAAEKTTEGQAAHESSEHGGNRVMRVAEDKGEQAGPHHFINKASGARDEEKKKNPNAKIGAAQMRLFQKLRLPGLGVLFDRFSTAEPDNAVFAS